MSAEALELLRAAAKARHAGDMQAFADTHTDDIEVWLNGLRVASGHEALLAHSQRYRTAFPDLTMQPTELIADQTRIFFDARMRGTHQGPFDGFDGERLEPSGRPFDLVVAVHFLLRDGRFSRTSEYINFREMRRQLTA